MNDILLKEWKEIIKNERIRCKHERIKRRCKIARYLFLFIVFTLCYIMLTIINI